MVSTCPKLANTTLSHKRVPEEGAFTLSVKGPEIVTVGVPFDLSVEVRNRGDKACSGLSLIVDGSDGQEGYVVHEAQITFPELIWPEQSVTSVLHVSPVRAGRLTFLSVQLKDGSDVHKSNEDDTRTERVYDFLQFFSCAAVEE